MKTQNPTKWENIKIFSSMIKGKRYPLHSKSNFDFFAFNPKQKPLNFSERTMTITHELITHVISELKEIKFVLNNQVVNIVPFDVKVEKLIELYCTEKKSYKKYYPDLLIHFSSNTEYAKKWGGRVAIEVVHTNPPSETKRKHFQFHGIPLLELNVSDSLKFKYERKEFDISKVESYHNYLISIFSQQIFVNQKYNTYSNRYLGNRLFNMKNKHEELSNQVRIFSDQIRKMEENYNRNKTRNEEVLRKFKNENTRILIKLNAILNRNKWNVILDLFRK